MPRTLEAGFEAQLEELHDRLHDCLFSTGPEARAAREIIESLIAGYQEELSTLRQRA